MSSSLGQAPLVLFVAFPQMELLDLTGPQSAFWVASKNQEQRGLPGYRRPTVSLCGGLIAVGIPGAHDRIQLFDLCLQATPALTIHFIHDLAQHGVSR